MHDEEDVLGRGLGYALVLLQLAFEALTLNSC